MSGNKELHIRTIRGRGEVRGGHGLDVEEKISPENINKKTAHLSAAYFLKWDLCIQAGHTIPAWHIPCQSTLSMEYSGFTKKESRNDGPGEKVRTKWA